MFNKMKWGRDRGFSSLAKCLNKSLDASLLRSSNRGVTSATSSTVTVLTSSNDSTGLTPLAPPVHCHNYHKHRLYNGSRNMTPTNQKELNVLYGQNNFSPIGDDELVKKEKDPATVDTSYTIQDGEDGDDFTLSKDESLPIKNDFSEPTSKIAYFPQVLAALSVSVCSMAVGFASAYTSPALVSMRESNSTVTISGQEASWIGGLMPLAALVGGIAGGPLIEMVGRKATILSTAVPFILSWLLIALAVNVPMILTGRAIAGFCVGIASLCLPVYLGETLQPEVRGMLGLLPTTLGNVGILLCFTAGSYLDWSQLAILGASIPVPFLILMFLIPETPRWYISKDKNGEAKKALQWLRGKDADITSELADIQKTHKEAEKNATDSVSDLFTKANVKPLMISIGLMFFQQFSGINAVIFYTVQIFKDAGSTIDKNLCTIIVGVVNFGSTFVATILIDRLGRKVLLYISAISMTVSLLTLGTFFYVRHEGYDVTEYGWLPLASFVTFVIGFSLGFGPIPWLMMGEILPAKIRGTAASVATAFNWSCTFIVTKTFTDVINVMGTYGTFWMFGIICFIGLFFIIFCVPETQGKSLEDIEKKFTGPVRRMSAIANLRPLPLSV